MGAGGVRRTARVKGEDWRAAGTSAGPRVFFNSRWGVTQLQLDTGSPVQTQVQCMSVEGMHAPGPPHSRALFSRE